MKKEQDKTKKNEGLYIEMRHAKLSTSSMKRSKCCVSPEKKTNYKNLDSEDYAFMQNLFWLCRTFKSKNT